MLFIFAALTFAISEESNGITCNLCKQIVSTVEGLITQEKTEQEIISLVQGLCEKFGAPYSTLCNSLVAQYVPTICQWVVQGIESIDICTKLGLCEATTTVVVRKANVPNGAMCDMCNAVVSYVEEQMVSAKVEEEIEKLVYSLCQTFPASVSGMCTTVCAEFLPLIMDWLEKGLESLDICNRIGLCTNSNFIVIKKTVAPLKVKESAGCTVCNSVVALVENLIQSSTVESKIEGLVKGYCETLSSPLSTLCDTVVDKFVPVIISLVEQGIESLHICVKLGLCEAETARPRIVSITNF